MPKQRFKRDAQGVGAQEAGWLTRSCSLPHDYANDNGGVQDDPANAGNVNADAGLVGSVHRTP
jgi:hypothetical protein